MIIKQLDKDRGVIESNRWRMKRVREVQNGTMENVIKIIKEALNIKSDLKSAIENKLFYEEVDNSFIEVLKETHERNEDDFIEILAECYMEKGTRGIKFCWGHLLL